MCASLCSHDLSEERLWSAHQHQGYEMVGGRTLMTKIAFSRARISKEILYVY